MNKTRSRVKYGVFGNLFAFFFVNKKVKPNFAARKATAAAREG